MICGGVLGCSEIRESGDLIGTYQPNWVCRGMAVDLSGNLRTKWGKLTYTDSRTLDQNG